MIYGCTTSTVMKYVEKKLDGNYTRMLYTVLMKQHPKKEQLYNHLTPISQTIQVRWAKHADHSWRSQDECKSNIILWTPSHGCTSVGWPDTGRHLKDLPRSMSSRDGGVRESRESMLWIQLHGDELGSLLVQDVKWMYRIIVLSRLTIQTILKNV